MIMTILVVVFLIWVLIDFIEEGGWDPNPWKREREREGEGGVVKTRKTHSKHWTDVYDPDKDEWVRYPSWLIRDAQHGSKSNQHRD